MRVSLIIPLYNEEATVDRLLSSIAGQALLPAEVLCVDAGSADATAERIAGFKAPFPLRLVRRGRLNPGEARNEGVRLAANEWLAFTDAGITLDPLWLARLVGAARPGVDVVFGSYEPVCDTFFRRCAALAYVAPYAREGIRGPFVASMALTRQSFDRAGGFPSSRASEDLVFLERLRALPLCFAFAPTAVVHWQTAPGPLATFRRFAVYSEANLSAGRGRFWHRGLLRQYVVVSAVLASGGLWFGTASLGVVPAWLLARATRAAWSKRNSLPFPTGRPSHLLGAAALLTLIDAATFVGALRFWVRRRSTSRRF